MQIPQTLTQAQIAAIRKAATEVLPACTDFLRAIVRIDTSNPPGTNYIECATVIADTLTALGYTVENIQVPTKQLAVLAPLGEGLPRVNVIGRLRGTGAGPTLHVNGHYDVVPVNGQGAHDPFEAVIEDGRMYGRGTADMKGGIAAQVRRYGLHAWRGLMLMYNVPLDICGRSNQTSGPDAARHDRAVSRAG